MRPKSESRGIEQFRLGSRAAVVLMQSYLSNWTILYKSQCFHVWKSRLVGGEAANRGGFGHGSEAPKYKCVHHSSRGEDGTEEGCGGWAMLQGGPRKGSRVVCKACGRFCGCGRPGCGKEAEGALIRVLAGKAAAAEKWCRACRREATMEAEEGEYYVPSSASTGGGEGAGHLYGGGRRNNVAEL